MPGRAGPRFPAGRSLVLVEEHPVAHAAGIPGEELVVPGFGPARHALQPLGVAELATQVMLREPADAGFKCLDSRFMAARKEQRKQEAGQDEAPSDRW